MDGEIIFRSTLIKCQKCINEKKRSFKIKIHECTPGMMLSWKHCKWHGDYLALLSYIMNIEYLKI